MDSNQEDNIIKSIIYGNQVQNRYGKFRAFCSAISAQEQIDKMVLYLREKESFKKYNKIVYAYRLFHKPAFFVTQDDMQQHEPEEKFIEGFDEDTTIEGSGEKLLHLLQKFNVENVLIAVGIEQYDPLSKFESSNFKIIVERAKDLLNNLYSRVIQSELDNNSQQQQQQSSQQYQYPSRIMNLAKNQAKVKKQLFQFPQIQPQNTFKTQQQKENNRPTHIYSQGKPKFLDKKFTDPQLQIERQRQRQMLQLADKLKEQGYTLGKITSSMEAKDYIQLRCAIQYDHNKLTEKILQMLMIITEMDSRDQLIYEYNLQEGLENMSVNDLDEAKVKLIKDMLRGDKKLNLDTINNYNPGLSPLFAFITILVKSYENGKKLTELEEIQFQNRNKNDFLDQPKSTSELGSMNTAFQPFSHDQLYNNKNQTSNQKWQQTSHLQFLPKNSQYKKNEKNLLSTENSKLNDLQQTNNVLQYSDEYLKQISSTEKMKILEELNEQYIEMVNSIEFHQGYWNRIGYKSQGKPGQNFNPKQFTAGFLESTYGDEHEFYSLEQGVQFHCFENDSENYEPCFACSNILNEYLAVRKKLDLPQDK